MDNKNRTKFSAALALLVSCSTALPAADVAITVVTPSRSPQALTDVPASIEVVIPEQLQTLPGTTLDEKLAALIPGLSTTRSAGDISNRSAALTMRGLGSSTQGGMSQGRTLILLDGVPLNNAATGGVNWNDLTIEDIERVEVFKGPSSSLYGSSALGGVINIITKGAKKGYSLETSYGTYNTLDTIAKAGARNGGLSVEVFGKHMQTDGYVQAAVPASYTEKTFVNENSAGAKASYDFKELGTLRADFSRYNGVTGMGTNYRHIAKGEYRESDTDLTRLSWKGSRGGLDWSAAFYDQQTDQTRAEGTTNAKKDDINVDRGDRGVLTSVSKELAGIRTTAGFDWKHGDVDGRDHYLAANKRAKDIGEMDSYAPFVQLEKKLFSDKLSLVGGARYDTVRFHDGYSENTSNSGLVTGNLREKTWYSFTPKVSAGYKYGEAVTQYVSYARGFRAGELEDMTLTLIKSGWYQSPNPDLKPEKAGTAETGFKLVPLSGLYVDPSVYITTAKDFIYQVATGHMDGSLGTEKQYRNIGKVQIYGAELPVKYIIGDLAVSASYAQSHSRVISSPGLTIKDHQLTYAPRHIYSAALSWKCNDTGYFANWTHKGRQFTNDANTASSSGYSVMNVGVAQKAGDNITVSLKYGNIFNQRFQQSVDTLAPGRTVTATVKLLF